MTRCLLCPEDSIMCAHLDRPLTRSGALRNTTVSMMRDPEGQYHVFFGALTGPRKLSACEGNYEEASRWFQEARALLKEQA